MAKEIYRKKSLERISAPEEMKDFIRVSSPAAWLVLTAVFLLLAGAVCWGFFGCLETVVPGAAISDGSRTLVFCAEEDAQSMDAGDTVRVGERELQIESVSSTPSLAGEVMDAYAMHLAGLEAEDWVYIAETGEPLPEMTAAAEIITDAIRPIRFFSSLND